MPIEVLAVSQVPSLYLVAQRFVGLALTHDYLSSGRGHRQLHRAVAQRTSATPRGSLPIEGRPAGSAPLRARSFSDAEQQYLALVAGQPRLSGAEEYQLAKRMRASDTTARNAMILANLGLVVMIARRHVRPGLPLLDLVAEGNLGLFSSADGFDPEMGFRFATYAKWWVMHRIRAAVRRFHAAQGIPVNPDTECPAADADEVSPEWPQRSTQDAETVTAAGDHSDEFSEAGGAECEPPHIALDHQRSTLLQRAMDLLPERDRAIVGARFALTETSEQTLAVLAQRYSLSIERVRQIERAALNKLASALQGFGVTADTLF